MAISPDRRRPGSEDSRVTDGILLSLPPILNVGKIAQGHGVSRQFWIFGAGEAGWKTETEIQELLTDP